MRPPPRRPPCFPQSTDSNQPRSGNTLRNIEVLCPKLGTGTGHSVGHSLSYLLPVPTPLVLGVELWEGRYLQL